MIFDNSKIKKLVPDFNPQITFRQGAKEIVKWYTENIMQKEPDQEINLLMNTIIHDYSRFVESVHNIDI